MQQSKILYTIKGWENLKFQYLVESRVWLEDLCTHKFMHCYSGSSASISTSATTLWCPPVGAQTFLPSTTINGNSWTPSCDPSCKLLLWPVAITYNWQFHPLIFAAIQFGMPSSPHLTTGLTCPVLSPDSGCWWGGRRRCGHCVACWEEMTGEWIQHLESWVRKKDAKGCTDSRLILSLGLPAPTCSQCCQILQHQTIHPCKWQNGSTAVMWSCTCTHSPDGLAPVIRFPPCERWCVWATGLPRTGGRGS